MLELSRSLIRQKTVISCLLQGRMPRALRLLFLAVPLFFWNEQIAIAVSHLSQDFGQRGTTWLVQPDDSLITPAWLELKPSSSHQDFGYLKKRPWQDGPGAVETGLGLSAHVFTKDGGPEVESLGHGFCAGSGKNGDSHEPSFERPFSSLVFSRSHDMHSGFPEECAGNPDSKMGHNPGNENLERNPRCSYQLERDRGLFMKTSLSRYKDISSSLNQNKIQLSSSVFMNSRDGIVSSHNFQPQQDLNQSNVQNGKLELAQKHLKQNLLHSHSKQVTHATSLLALDPPNFDFDVGLPRRRDIFRSNPALLKYVLPFENLINEFHNKCQSFKKKTEQRFYFEDIAAVKVLFSVPQSLFDGGLPGKGPEMCKRSISIIRLAAVSRLYQKRTRIIALMRNLISCLLFEQSMFLHKLGQSEYSEKELQDNFFHWLLEEFFNPKMSLPVMGVVKFALLSYDRSAFQESQKSIIDYLSSGNASMNALQTAGTLIGIWLKNMHCEYWITQFDNDQIFWHFLHEAASQAPVVELDDYSPAGGPFVPMGQLGNFLILSFEQILLSSSTPKLNLLDARNRFQTAKESMSSERIMCLENTLIDHMYDCYSKRIQRVNTAEPAELQHLGVRLAGLKEENFGRRSYLIRIGQKPEKVINASHLEVKVRKLFNRLRHYHALFVAFAPLVDKEIVPDAHLQLVKWLTYEMVQPRVGVPVFGVVEESDKTHNYCLGEFQKYLIALFISKTQLPSQEDQIYSTILGYWYKHERKEYWLTQFQSDLEYWKFMANAIDSSHVFYHYTH